LLVQSSWKGVFQMTGAIAVGTVIFLLPVLSEIPRLIQWFADMATHTGVYGGGAEGFIDPRTYFTDLRTMMFVDRLLLTLGIASAIVSSIVLFSRPENPGVRRHARLLFLTTLVQAFGVFLIAKHPHPRYLVPLAASCTFNVFLIAELAKFWPARAQLRQVVVASVAAGSLSLAILAGVDVLRLSTTMRVQRDSEIAHHQQAVAVSRGGTPVGYYRSSSPEFALYFGNNSAGHRYGALLEELYPRRVFLNFWTGCFENFSRRLTRDEILRSAPIYLIGNNRVESLPPGILLQHPPPWSLSLIQRTSDKTIHRLDSNP
jgi:hypothetical protein